MKLKRLLVLLFVISALTVPGYLHAQEVTVKGKIVDSKTNQPLAGATVKVKNTTTVTISDDNGAFTIKAPSTESVITITYVGYAVYETKAGDGNLEVKLNNLGTDLNEVVVIGYGSQKRANLTGSMATVDMKRVEDLPVASLAEALKGQIPGLNVSGGSQRPGDNATLTIRQQFSYSKDGSSSLPLIIIDDVIQLDPSTGRPTMDQFNLLDPSEVESITVLRDAAASIYGARATQGAILVKTKKGKMGAPKISYSGKFEMNDAVSFGKTMSAYEHGVFANRFGRAAKWANNYYFDANELESMKSLNYDWLKEAWKAAGAMQNSLNVSGGSDRATYFAGGSYYSQSANLGSQDYNKWAFRSGLDVKVINNLKFSGTLSVNKSKVEKSFTKISISDGGYTSGSEQTDYVVLAHMPKYIPWQYDVNGVTHFVSPALGPNRVQNTPVGQNNISGWNYFALLDNGSFTQDDNQSFNTSFSLQYDVPFVKGLSLRASYGSNYTAYNNEQAMLGLELSAATNTNAAGNHLYTDSTNWSTGINNNRSTVRYSDVIGKVQQGNFYITYDNHFGKHNISAMASVEKGVQNYQKKFIIYDVPIYGAYNGSSSSAGTLNSSNTYVNKTDLGSLGYLGRVSYDYDGRYLLQFVFRTDASTKFSPENYWGFFPGVSAGWVVSKENWFADKFEWVDYLKVRGSIGLTGKDNVAAWRWIQTYTYVADKGMGFGTNNGGLLVASLTPDATPNSSVHWDKTVKKNLGIDLTLLKNRLSVSYDRYWDNNTEILMPMSGTVGVPISVGGAFAEQNYGAQKIWGSEFSATWKEQKKNFGYSIGINFGTGDNKITKWTSVAFDYPSKNQTQEGYSSSIRPAWGFLTWKGNAAGDGLLRTDADIDAYWTYLTDLATQAGTTPSYLGSTAKSAIKKGMLAYQDIAGDLNTAQQTIAGANGRVSENEDYAQLIKKNRSTGFVTNIGFNWKQITFNTQISTSWGGFNRIDYVKQGTSSGQILWSHESYLNDMYDSLDNGDGKWPNIYHSQNFYTSDFWQISSFRCFVRSLTVGYTVPKNITSRLRMESLKVSLAGFNLWDFYNPYPEKYRNMYDDPKAAYPTLRTWAFGINATF